MNGIFKFIANNTGLSCLKPLPFQDDFGDVNIKLTAEPTGNTITFELMNPLELNVLLNDAIIKELGLDSVRILQLGKYEVFQLNELTTNISYGRAEIDGKQFWVRVEFVEPNQLIMLFLQESYAITEFGFRIYNKPNK